VLLLVGGAAPPAAHDDLRPVISSTSGFITQSLLTPSTLYTVDDGIEVHARPLRPGGAQWTAAVALNGDRVHLDRAGSVLIARSGGEATFLDAATGAELWHSPLDPVVVGDRVATWAVPEDDGPGRLRVAALRTGRTLWSRAAEATAITGSVSAGVLVTVDFEGYASVFALADGRVRLRHRDLTGGHTVEADANLVFDSYRAEEPADLGMTMIAGRLYLYGTSFVAAYRPGDLKRLWHIGKGATSIAACGPAVCGAAPDGIRLLDPATGTLRRSATGWQSVDDHGVAVDAAGQATLVDLGTGRDVRRLGRGAPAGDLLLLDDSGGPVTRSWVAGLDDGRLIGKLPGVRPFGCAALGDLLTCPAVGAAVTVWQVRR
jgi:hypothetical protein